MNGDFAIVGRRTRGLIASVVVAATLAAGASSRIDAAGEGARTIAFHHIHTNETLSIVYKKDGKYIPEALKKIDWIMRDWRKNEVIAIDPATIDLLWEMHTELGSRAPIDIICGYRSRDTNELLRRTVGGQASQSQHITGKAIDVTFPDVPLKKIRYSALVRERGGVGYYPTSGIPFVHVDTASVRHWPRLPRYELALLFPNGHSKYVPTDGEPISPADVRIAQTQHHELATEIAQYLDDRAKPHAAVLVADAGNTTAAPRPAQGFVQASLGGARASTPPPKEAKMAGLAPSPVPPAPAPQLVATPRLVERSSQLIPGPIASAGPSRADRSKLDALVTLASFESEAPPAPRLLSPPRPALRPTAKSAPAAVSNPSVASAGTTLPPPPLPQAAPAARPDAPQVAALDPAQAPRSTPGSLLDSGWGSGWVPAPAFDEEHPEELSYHPFPVAPLLTTSASADDPVLTRLEHPDVARTLDMIDDNGEIRPMRFRPGQQVAQVMWAQQFQGRAVALPASAEPSGASSERALADRKVHTSAR